MFNIKGKADAVLDNLERLADKPQKQLSRMAELTDYQQVVSSVSKQVVHEVVQTFEAWTQGLKHSTAHYCIDQCIAALEAHRVHYPDRK